MQRFGQLYKLKPLPQPASLMAVTAVHSKVVIMSVLCLCCSLVTIMCDNFLIKSRFCEISRCVLSGFVKHFAEKERAGPEIVKPFHAQFN